MVLTRRRKEGVQNPKNLANVICTCPLTRRRAKSRNLALGSHSTEKSEWPMNGHDIVRLMSRDGRSCPKFLFLRI